MTEIFDLEGYNNKKKQEYYFEYDCSDDIFFYKITFNKPVTRKAFMNMMEKAGKVEEPYSVLRDKDFQMKHHIKKFERLPIDYQDVI